MKKSIPKITSMLLLSMFMAVSMSITVFAHTTMSDFYPNADKNEGVIQFYYDNDDVMSDVEITVFNTHGTEIATGRTDGNGLFDFTAYENVGHVIARADAEHIQIHPVAESGGYIVGKDFGGTYIGYSDLNGLLRNFVLERYWFTVFAIIIPVVIFTASLVYFIINQKKTKKKAEVNQNV